MVTSVVEKENKNFASIVHILMDTHVKGHLVLQFDENFLTVRHPSLISAAYLQIL